MLSEPELIALLRKQDPAAFRQLYQQYAQRIYNTALGFMGDRADAEDVVQEVFIDVFKNIEKFKGDARLSTWLYRLTANRALEMLRGRTRKKRSGKNIRIDAYEGEFPLPHFNHPGVAAENRELADVLFAAIAQLPDQQRMAFTLQKVEGLSQQEISDIMETSISSVESLLFRAKENLKISLLKYYKDL